MIELRRLTHDDYEDIVDITKDIWDGFDYLPMVFHQWVDDEGFFLGAVDIERNKVTGFGKLSILHDGSGWLEGLRVHKEYRGQKLARSISEWLLNVAKGYLNDGKIKRIAFSTQIGNVESMTLMKKLNFVEEQKLLIILKSSEGLEKGLSLENFRFEKWTPSFEEFISFPYFKRRKNMLPLAFYFQEPTLGLYNELMKDEAFVSINGYKGVYKFKEGPYFECMDETFEAIDAFMNYYLLKFSDPAISFPITSVLPENKELIQRCMEEGYITWTDWVPDYLYFVYKE